ncbi:hypothetical protein PR048_014167 [Dryococelus australis]|uniref:Uncharacterized protein n=1 Tax=Dryococelus australis TaxID=614101 RepID=A0ABQ9HDG9_9NEOP|nr:hypothetical protein PR048_014167 [Dryococelus australis]
MVARRACKQRFHSGQDNNDESFQTPLCPCSHEIRTTHSYHIISVCAPAMAVGARIRFPTAHLQLSTLTHFLSMPAIFYFRPLLWLKDNVRYLADSLPDFRKWESCWTMPLAGGFSRGIPVSPALAIQRRSILGSHLMSCPGMTVTYGSQLNARHSESVASPWIRAALNIEVLRADEGEARCVWRSAGMKGRGKREIPRKASDQYDPHMRKSRDDPVENRTQFALMGDELADKFPVRQAGWGPAAEGPGREPTAPRLQVGHPTPELSAGWLVRQQALIDEPCFGDPLASDAILLACAAIVSGISGFFASDKIDFKREYTEVTIAIGSEFIRNTLDDIAPIADFQGNKQRIPHLQHPDGNTARLARKSDEALDVRVSVARIAPLLLDLGRGDPTGHLEFLYRRASRWRRFVTLCSRAPEMLFDSAISQGPPVFVSHRTRLTPRRRDVFMSAERARVGERRTNKATPLSTYLPLRFRSTGCTEILMKSPQGRLLLKAGAPYTSLRSLNTPNRCNSSRLQVKAWRKDVIEATVFSGRTFGKSGRLHSKEDCFSHGQQRGLLQSKLTYRLFKRRNGMAVLLTWAYPPPNWLLEALGTALCLIGYSILLKVPYWLVMPQLLEGGFTGSGMRAQPVAVWCSAKIFVSVWSSASLAKRTECFRNSEWPAHKALINEERSHVFLASDAILLVCAYSATRVCDMPHMRRANIVSSGSYVADSLGVIGDSFNNSACGLTRVFRLHAAKGFLLAGNDLLVSDAILMAFEAGVRCMSACFTSANDLYVRNVVSSTDKIQYVTSAHAGEERQSWSSIGLQGRAKRDHLEETWPTTAVVFRSYEHRV